MLRQIYAARTPPASAQPEPRPATGLTSILPSDLLARARELDAEHRAPTGRPISRTPSAITCGSGAIGRARSSPS